MDPVNALILFVMPFGVFTATKGLEKENTLSTIIGILIVITVLTIAFIRINNTIII